MLKDIKKQDNCNDLFDILIRKDNYFNLPDGSFNIDESTKALSMLCYGYVLVPNTTSNKLITLNYESSDYQLDKAAEYLESSCLYIKVVKYNKDGSIDNVTDLVGQLTNCELVNTTESVQSKMFIFELS
jgi:hypothetical protein